MSEMLCLQWNDYHENIKSTFRNLRADNDFADVTLVCEDGQQVEAHKVILAASSPFFRKLLVRNTHPHPLVYMRKMNSDDMMAIVDFLYNGETNVHQENLERFFAVAEELQLKGLMGKLNEKVEEFDERDAPPKEKPLVGKPAKIPKTLPYSQISSGNISEREGTVALSNYFSGALEELEERVKSMMEKSKNKIANGKQMAYKCKVCGKEGKDNAIKDHIEANHLDGIVIPCELCNKTFRSRNSYRPHRRQHQNRLFS